MIFCVRAYSSNHPVRSLVRTRNFKNLATQMTTHGHTWTRTVTSNVTLIWPEFFLRRSVGSRSLTAISSIHRRVMPEHCVPTEQEHHPQRDSRVVFSPKQGVWQGGGLVDRSSSLSSSAH